MHLIKEVILNDFLQRGPREAVCVLCRKRDHQQIQIEVINRPLHLDTLIYLR